MAKDTHAHIGHLAGVVYKTLEKRASPMSVMGIAFSAKLWPWDVLLAVGWLMREDKIRLKRKFIALFAELK
ncbi:MAG: winged helix-turn-helix domain-containing protein [Candidatus Altiarchaeota archaeon]|nr:winged helix-turn-helix domain-containing protein [Candidatus Altiarchaeota archaeon]